MSTYKTQNGSANKERTGIIGKNWAGGNAYLTTNETTSRIKSLKDSRMSAPRLHGHKAGGGASRNERLSETVSQHIESKRYAKNSMLGDDDDELIAMAVAEPELNDYSTRGVYGMLGYGVNQRNKFAQKNLSTMQRDDKRFSKS